MVQEGRQPASSRKRARTRVPCSVCMTSGWNWTPNSPSVTFSTAATGVASVCAVTAKPGGAAVAVSPWDIQTVWRDGRPARSIPPAGGSRGSGGNDFPPGAGGVWGGFSPRGSTGGSSPRMSTVAPYSLAPVWATVPPRPATMSWKP
jgi:hypothetical protein